jgi:hypothetical protein
MDANRNINQAPGKTTGEADRAQENLRDKHKWIEIKIRKLK